jgi:hypothetical protein
MQRNQHIFIVLFLFISILMMGIPAHAAPLSATALLAGRTYDQAHDTGYIDWSGSGQYVRVTHRDGSSLPADEGGTFCTPSCREWVTRLGTGGIASGSFDRDVSYFEIMVEFTNDSNVGSATLRACSAVSTWNMYNSAGSLPGYVSMVITVPTGCRTWSISASGGYVDFRSIDVEYLAPPDTATATATLIPSATPSATWTSTSTSTPTDTATLTATVTSTNTATATDTPTATFTATFTASPTATDTLTSTPTHTSTATFTNTPLPSATHTGTPTPKPLQVMHQIHTPTALASFTTTQTPTSTGTAVPPTAVPSIRTPTSSTATPVRVATASSPPRRPAPSMPLWQLLGLIGLFLVIASASVVDPRPAALDRLRERMDQLLTNSSNDETRKF